MTLVLEDADMRLAIVRHGKAERDSADGTDGGRCLTDRGTRQAMWLGEALAHHTKGKVVLVSSPIVRSRMTADLIATALGVRPFIDTRLGTDRGVRDCIDVIDEMSIEHAPGSLVIVGHNPHFEALASALLPDGGAHRSMRTGECCALEVDPPVRRASGRLVAWLRMEEPED